MSKYLFIVFFLITSTSSLIGYSSANGFKVKKTGKIKGVVKNQDKSPLTGVSIFAKGTYDGTTSDSLGQFSFSLSRPKDSVTIVARYLGHAPFSQTFLLTNNELFLNITLIDTNASTNTVVITAGAFEASDEKKGVLLRPLDIVTTAGAMGDIAAALTTLPGTQAVGEDGQLFVRGGTAGETRTFIDGMRAPFFYTSQVPDVPARGRFSPFLFKGTLFTTGGYSAEYGQALSSALILETQDLPKESQTSVSLMTIGLGAAHTQRWKKSSLSVSADYTNMAPYFSLIPQRFSFQQFPEGVNGAIGFRQQMGKTNLLKGYGTFSRNEVALSYPAVGNDAAATVRLVNENSYLQSTGRWLAGKWLINGGLTYTTNLDRYNLADGDVERNGKEAQGKITFWRSFSKKISLRTGATVVRAERSEYFTPKGTTIQQGGNLNETLAAAFAEADIRIGRKWALRTGLRSEYSTLLQRANLAPRLSLAWQTSKYGQISAAYGVFYQNPPYERLWSEPTIDYEQSQHLMLNYQWSKSNRTFRIEGYYKQYNRLLRFDPTAPYNPNSITSDGDGFA
ncbi:MAG: carboxypeptidase-like regulatory domain-containing protein, partial [Bacteroidia bacterium]